MAHVFSNNGHGRGKIMAPRKETLEAKKRILSASVRLFLLQGYHATTINQILKEAQVPISNFQTIFHTKDGILGELMEFMFRNQFGTASAITGEQLPLVYVYAVETAIQLVLTEQNENLRDIYLEVYSQPETAEYIYEHTTMELYRIFGQYLPGCSQGDFYDMEIGTAGIMRGYMSKKCTMHFPLEKKLECFLRLSLRSYKVPEEEQEQVLEYIRKLDVSEIAGEVMRKLFAALEMQYNVTLNL